MSLQNTALAYRSFGIPERTLALETQELTAPAANAVRVRMKLAPINPSDLIPITGAYGHRITPPLVASYEGVNPLAAMLMLQRWNPANKRVLITAAGSSCAGLLRQWALDAGAREVIDVYRAPSPRSSLERADLIFDAVGGALASSILSATRKDATFVSYGLLSGEMFAAGADCAKVERFHIRDCLNGLAADTWQAWFTEIWRRLRATRLPDTARFPLADWRKALAFFREPGRTSKPLLVLD